MVRPVGLPLYSSTEGLSTGVPTITIRLSRVKVARSAAAGESKGGKTLKGSLPPALRTASGNERSP
jgi:hypothetical protein